MGIISAFKNAVQMCRNFISTIRALCKTIYDARIILVAIIIMYILYRFLPSLLIFFISCCPILVCTAVLLNTLFSFGSSNNTQDEETKKTHEASVNSENDVDQKPGTFPLQSRLRKRNNIRERALQRSGMITIDKSLSRRQRRVVFSSLPTDDSLSGRKDVGVIEEPQPREVASAACSSSTDVNDQSSDNDSDEGETSTFCSDKAECSSPESPPSNVLPVIDEKDPLLDTKPPQIPLTSPDEFGGVLECSDRSLDGSVDSEIDNTQGTEEDGAKACIKWTEDDQKNLMDLGTSELERNKRLESLIARRRARKNNLLEKNLIDFDTNDPVVPSISTRGNPFDLPYNQSDIDGLPPIPGSAPSVLVPRKNPFDLPYDPQEEKPNLTQDSFQQEFLSVFCRHESFSYGSSYTSSKQDKYNTKFTPFFAPEGTTAGGGSEFSNPVGRSGERRSSIFGPDSDSLPPIDRRNRKKQMDRVLSLGVYPTSYSEFERRIPETKTVQEVKREPEVETKEVAEDLSSHDKKDTSSSSSSVEPEVVKESKSEEVQEKNIEAASSVDDSNNADSTSTEPEPSTSVEESESDHKEEAVEEEVDDVHTKEPVYDSSPSAVEKRTIDEYLIYSDKGPLTCSSSIASDLQVEVSEAGSPGESIDRYPYACRDNAVEEREVRPVEETSSKNNNSSSSAQPVDGNDHITDAHPSSAESEMHVQGSKPDLEVVDSMAPSPSSDVVQEEISTVQPSSDADHSEPPQEASLKSSEETNSRDNVEAATTADVAESNGVPETREAEGTSLANPTENTILETNAVRGHETAENNEDQKSSEDQNL